jgi:hypothetical protein
MTEAQVWSVVALFAIAGFATFVVQVARGVLPQANALGSLQKTDALIDERISKILDRIRIRQNPQQAAHASQPSQNGSQTNPIEELFGGAPLEPIGDQPDSGGLEVVS